MDTTRSRTNAVASSAIVGGSGALVGKLATFVVAARYASVFDVCPTISRVLMPRVYIEITLSSKPKKRRCYLVISSGSKLASRSRGTSRSKPPLSHTTIRRIWSAFGLQPHRGETFKLSTDPLLDDKVQDIVGIYMSPPNRAIVLCVDEKSQIQALDREQPVLPMAPGVPERRTHTYSRHGTTALFAALDIATGAVIGKCYKRHRATEFLDFLKKIDRSCPRAGRAAGDS